MQLRRRKDQIKILSIEHKHAFLFVRVMTFKDGDADLDVRFYDSDGDFIDSVQVYQSLLANETFKFKIAIPDYAKTWIVKPFVSDPRSVW